MKSETNLNSYSSYKNTRDFCDQTSHNPDKITYWKTLFSRVFLLEDNGRIAAWIKKFTPYENPDPNNADQLEIAYRAIYSKTLGTLPKNMRYLFLYIAHNDFERFQKAFSSLCQPDSPECLNFRKKHPSSVFSEFLDTLLFEIRPKNLEFGLLQYVLSHKHREKFLKFMYQTIQMIRHPDKIDLDAAIFSHQTDIATQAYGKDMPTRESLVQKPLYKNRISFLFYYACKSGNFEMAQYLFRRKNLDYFDALSKFDLIVDTVRSGNFQLIEFLFKVGAKLKQGSKISPIILAAQLGHSSILKFLLEQEGASIPKFSDAHFYAFRKVYLESISMDAADQTRHVGGESDSANQSQHIRGAVNVANNTQHVGRSVGASNKMRQVESVRALLEFFLIDTTAYPDNKESYYSFDDNLFFKTLPASLQTALKKEEATFIRRKNLLGKKLFGEEASGSKALPPMTDLQGFGIFSCQEKGMDTADKPRQVGNNTSNTPQHIERSVDLSNNSRSATSKEDRDNNNTSPTLSSNLDGSS